MRIIQLLEWDFVSVFYTCVVKENAYLISMFCFMKPLMVRSIKIFVCWAILKIQYNIRMLS
jgi:hypothetical protein